MCDDLQGMNMYPVIPSEMNHLAADSLFYLMTAISALLSVICSLR
jgi:hypothetical protein